MRDSTPSLPPFSAHTEAYSDQLGNAQWREKCTGSHRIIVPGRSLLCTLTRRRTRSRRDADLGERNARALWLPFVYSFRIFNRRVSAHFVHVRIAPRPKPNHRIPLQLPTKMRLGVLLFGARSTPGKQWIGKHRKIWKMTATRRKNTRDRDQQVKHVSAHVKVKGPRDQTSGMFLYHLGHLYDSVLLEIQM